MHFSRLGVCSLLTGLQLTAGAVVGEAEAPATATPLSPRLTGTLAKRPLAFEENRGQANPRVSFVARGRGYSLFLTGAEAVLALAGADDGAVLAMRLLGARERPEAEPLDPLPGSVNYYVGNDSTRWQQGIPTFARARFREVYPGIDLEYYGTQGELEYDLVVRPGGDPASVQLALDGAECVEMRGDGAVVASLGAAELVLAPPTVHQGDGPDRRTIPGAYTLLAGNVVAVSIGAYDPSKPLVIDPLALVYSSYLGGCCSDSATDAAVGSDGCIYLTGLAWSRDFPTVNAIQATKPDPESVQCGVVPYPPRHCYSNCPFVQCADSFVSKLSPDGASLVYSTYLGGTSDDRAAAIAVDAAGNAYVVGTTYSDNFPVLNAIRDRSETDTFVTQLGPNGTLLLSSYFGGWGYDSAADMALDGAGKVIIVGTTVTGKFPTTEGVFRPVGAWQMCDMYTVWVHECTAGFIAKLDLAARSVDYASLLGPKATADLDASAVATDAAGNAYAIANGWLYKVNPSGSQVLYSKVVYGGVAVAVDAAGAAYVTGSVTSGTIPTTPGAFDTTKDGTDAFALKLAPNGQTFAYATYLGGSGADLGNDIAVGGDGQAVVAGSTTSTDFPTAGGPVDSTCGSDGACNGGKTDAFVVKLGATGQHPVYSTYLGGALDDEATGVALAANGDAVIGGWTSSSDLPTAGAYQSTLRGTNAAFAARIAQQGCYLDCSATAPLAGRVNDPFVHDVTLLQPGCTGTPTYDWDFGDGTAHASVKTPSHAYLATGSYTWQVTTQLEGQSCSATGTIAIGCTVGCGATVPSVAQDGEPVSFAATSNAPSCWDQVGYTWDFGDGSPAGSGAGPTHSYAAPGLYSWTMIATADGVECRRTGTIGVFAPPVVFADTFEADLPGLWQQRGSPAWARSTGRKFSGTSSAKCTAVRGSESSLVIGPFSLAGAAAAQVTFAYFMKATFCTLFVKASTDGSTFSNSVEYAWDTPWGDWDTSGIDLASFGSASLLGQSQVWLAFVFTGRDSWLAGGEGVYLDDVRIEKYAGTGLCTLHCSALVPGTVQALADEAKFTGYPKAVDCGESVYFNFDWDYGDGSAHGTWNGIEHQYSTAGDFAWTMTASLGGESCQSTGTIHVDPPPPCELSCTASAASTAYATDPVAFSSTVSGDYCTGQPDYDWDFGDATAHSTSQNPSHAYSAPGTYTWTLNSTLGGVTCTKTGTITIDPAPPCRLSCTATAPANAGVGQAIAFQGSATPGHCSGAVGYRWAFGDGAAIATDQNPSHAFASKGAYQWTFIATADGTTCMRAGTVTVADAGSETVFQDGFEGAWPGSWSVTPAAGTTWGQTGQRAAEGTKSAYCAAGGSPTAPPGGPYLPNINTGMVYGPFSLVGATGARATFRYWLKTELDWDWFWWMVSIDNQQFSGNRISGFGGDWVAQEFDFADVTGVSALGSSTVWLGFFFTSDTVVQDEGVYVDDVRIEKTVPGVAGCTVACAAAAPGPATVGVAAAFQATATLSDCAGGAEFSWSFGDGGPPSTQQNPTHTYTTPGLHLWQVTATADGSVGGASGVVEAIMPPTAPIRRRLRH